MYINRAVEVLWREPCLASQVRRLHRMIVGAYDDSLRSSGLTVAQLDLLMTLLTSDTDVRPIDLARDMRMDRSTLSRNLDRLKTRGLVASAPGGNARESHLTVTPTGRRTAEEAADAWLTAQQATKVRLGDEGIAAINTLTRRLTTH